MPTATARKSGRSPTRPYVPVIKHSVPRDIEVQIKGYAFATRDEALTFAQRYIDQVWSNQNG